MKGVIYARYSSDNQREESIEGQLRECKDYAERNGITILGTYIDRALSAKTDNRPEFQKMIKDSAKGLFDVVLVWKLDRFARNRYDSARYKNLLKKNGVKVISARENISEGSEGIILEAMLEGYAEYYSAELSEKVIRGLTDNALKCKYNGGTVPMGYYIDEQQFYQIDPKTAPVVLEMFTKYSEGATMQELVNLLNSRGMRSIRGGKITLNIMNHLLKNRRYMGEYSYRDVVKEDGIPAIVPKELFERVQERLAKNKKAPARHKAEDDYLLTTKLYCGKCGSFMVGESGTSHTMKVHRYYRCVNTKKKKLCDKKAVKKDWIEDLVVNYTMKAIMNDEVMERLIDTLMELQKKESTDLPLLKKQLAETEKGINNMLNAIQAGIFTPSTKQRLDELEETKSQLEVSILQEEMHKPLLTREQIAFFIYRFRKFDVTKREQRQRLIDSFVNAVYLYEDKIILTFNYKDGSKTITLADVEGSDLSSFGAADAVPDKPASCATDSRVSNVFVVIHDGALIATYRKLHLYDAFAARESDTVRPGTELPPIVEIDGWHVGVMTCYDVRFPEVARSLAVRGADVIIVSAAWARGRLKERHWKLMTAARALENTCYVLACSEVSARNIGCSRVIDPLGEVIAQAGDGQGEAGGQAGMLIARLHREVLESARRTLTVLENRRFADPQLRD